MRQYYCDTTFYFHNNHYWTLKFQVPATSFLLAVDFACMWSSGFCQGNVKFNRWVLTSVSEYFSPSLSMDDYFDPAKNDLNHESIVRLRAHLEKSA